MSVSPSSGQKLNIAMYLFVVLSVRPLTEMVVDEVALRVPCWRLHPPRSTSITLGRTSISEAVQTEQDLLDIRHF